MDQELVRGAEVGLDLEREELLAAFAGRLENGQRQDLLVEVEGDIAAELLGVVEEDLEKRKRDVKKKTNT